MEVSVISQLLLLYNKDYSSVLKVHMSISRFALCFVHLTTTSPDERDPSRRAVEAVTAGAAVPEHQNVESVALSGLIPIRIKHQTGLVDAPAGQCRLFPAHPLRHPGDLALDGGVAGEVQGFRRIGATTCRTPGLTDTVILSASRISPSTTSF